MKSLIVVLWLIVIMIGIMLSSCTEEIYLDKWLYDTIYVDKPQALAPKMIVVTDSIIVKDTVEVRVVIHDVDTVFQIVTRDSIIIKEVEKIVTVLDTVIINQIDTIFVTDTVVVNQYDRTVVYLDTAYVMINIRNATSIPAAIQPHVSEFFGPATQYNKPEAIGGHMVIQYTNDLPGEGWVSHSYWVGGRVSFSNPYAQMVIEISESLPPELHRASIFRELARLQLQKKYVTDVNKIMSPLFDPYTIITKQHLDVLFQ